MTPEHAARLDAAELPGRPGAVGMRKDLAADLIEQHERMVTTLEWLRRQGQAGRGTRVRVTEVYNMLTGNYLDGVPPEADPDG